MDLWKIINEPTHAHVWRSVFGWEFWDELFEVVKKSDPSVKLLINDYDLLRGDAAQCYVENVQHQPIDFMGLQGQFL